MDQSQETDIAELIGSSGGASARPPKSPVARAREAVERLFAPLRRIDEDPTASSSSPMRAGSWQIPVDWRAVLLSGRGTRLGVARVLG
jgi:hypothetical protein